MTPGNLPLALRRNVPSAQRLEMSDIDGSPVDLTGATLAMQVRLYDGAVGDPLLTVSTANGRIAIDPLDHSAVTIDWPGVVAAIRAMPSGAEAGDPTRRRRDVYAYDLVVTWPDGSRQVLLEGTVPVSFGVTTI